jgi:DNA polymerase III epsilon subunit-like protein
MRTVAFDLETTGVGETDRILEFCFVELGPDLEPLAPPWSELVNPGVPVPAEAVAIHAITDEMVAGKLPLSAHAPRIQRLVQDALLIGHNVGFDIRFLDRELRAAGQAGLSPSHARVDTYDIERFVNGHSLGACFQRYTGTPLDGAHRSAADAVATVEVLRRQRIAHKGTLPDALDGLQPQRLFGEEPNRVRHWLDHGHRFYRDGQGTIRLAFGPHRHAAATSEPGFLKWMLTRDFADDAKAVARDLLALVEPGGRPPTAAPPAASPSPPAPRRPGGAAPA